MFEKLINELERLEREKIHIPVDSDIEGYLDRECPDTNCEYQFKIHKDDWRDICRDEQIFCPLCRHEAKSDSWWTKQQLEAAREEGFKQIHNIIDRALVAGSRDFNAKQPKNAFLQLRMNYTSRQPFHILMPIPASEVMTLKVSCEVCHTRYAVIGSAFFCPSCGHNSAAETFESSVRKIEDKIKHLPTIRKAIEAHSTDEAETTCRSLMESSLNEGVVAFQRFCEVSFVKVAPQVKVKFNAFQNLDTGSVYWKNLFGEGYEDWISTTDLLKMTLLFQRRHLLSHTEGIVDQKYINRSGDTTYKPGQRLVVKAGDVYELTRLIMLLVKHIRAKLILTLPPALQP